MFWTIVGSLLLAYFLIRVLGVLMSKSWFWKVIGILAVAIAVYVNYSINPATFKEIVIVIIGGSIIGVIVNQVEKKRNQKKITDSSQS